jgi:hypothetical protein
MFCVIISIDHCNRKGHINNEFSYNNQGDKVKGEKSYVSDYLSCNEMDLSDKQPRQWKPNIASQQRINQQQSPGIAMLYEHITCTLTRALTSPTPLQNSSQTHLSCNHANDHD